MEERDFCLGFSTFSGIGPKRFASLLVRFGTARDAWHATYEDLRPILGPFMTRRFRDHRKVFSITGYREYLRRNNIVYLSISEEDYPRELIRIENPPIILFIRGASDLLRNRNAGEHIWIGVVGTRKITGYGRQVTGMITAELVRGGYVIVSGLALGVDAVAHSVALEGAGKTVAVLGSGVNICHPLTNKPIYQKIIEGGGAIIAEYPPDDPPSVGSFPARNRIIAGLSDGVVVTEGAEDSGSLITAEQALAYDKKVFAVPGPITSSLSQGPNALLAKGAKIVSKGSDIIKAFQNTPEIVSSPAKEIRGDTTEEQRIIDLLLNEPLSFDELVRATGYASSSVAATLSAMELKAVIVSDNTGVFTLRMN